MTFNRLFRASLYLTLFLATTLLNIDASRDSQYAMLYPIVVAGTSFLAFLTVDRDSKRGIPRDLANFLALIAALLGLVEWYNNPDLLLLAIGHTLVYFQLIYNFLEKTVEVDWILFLIGLVQAVVGVYISQSDIVGFLVLSWALSALWTFALFFLRRESLQGEPPHGVVVTPPTDPTNPYPGLINLKFVFSMLRIAGLTLLLGVGIFLVMPRWAAPGVKRYGPASASKHLTGFSDSVQLGRMGEILEQDSPVMSVEFSDETNTVIAPEPDILLRGVTMTNYKDRRWTREPSDEISAEKLDLSITPREARTKILRQRYKMEETDNEALFAVRPVFQVESSMRSEIEFRRTDGTISRSSEKATSRQNKFDYTVISGPFGRGVQLYENTPDNRRLRSLTRVPDDLTNPLSEIAEAVAAKLRPEARRSRLEVARALERYLRDGEFGYTLKMRTIDREIDPVLDFLKNRKEGHCEYFASALTLLCRSQGIPARMVNGFKGGDWNDLGRVLSVRQKHAHSWVEVLVGERGEEPRWETLDPTPSRQRAESVAQVKPFAQKFRYVSDYIRYLWTFNVVGFDSERQQRLIYGPARQLLEVALRGFVLIGQMFKDAASWFYFEDVGQFFSVRGFFVSFAAMSALVVLFRVGQWLIRRLFGHALGGKGFENAADPGLLFYQRLVKLLATVGVERPPAETPREFARRASLILEARGPLAPFTQLPAMVVDVFYAKKYGQIEPDIERLREVDSALDLFETTLNAPVAS